ncbi:gamma-aminobutyric acid type B receptor subunit 2-like [Branchiostoma lanceolatum]|uniref:gamma-aminobutyric acid type B receptor subunit 2-like n=1 Tax=Branchiostoma lanceolatum TaxID=7740 RepID=UPI0034561A8A
MHHVVFCLAIMHIAMLPVPSPATAASQPLVETCGPSDTEEVKLVTDVQDRRTVYIGGLFALGRSPYASKGYSELTAARLAIKHVNDAQMIPGIQLKMFCNNTQCDSGVGIDAFFDMIYRKPGMTMLLGAHCSSVSKSLAQVVPLWNLVMVSYASTSPALSDRKLFPTFFRTEAPDSSHNAARRAFIQYFDWQNVAVLYQDQEMFSLSVDAMVQDFEDANVTLISTGSFSDDPSEQMNNLKERDARIIIGSFEEAMARTVFCKAFQLGMYGKKYVWILLGWYQTGWWLAGGDTGCSAEQLSMATEGYFTVDTLDTVDKNQTLPSGVTVQEVHEELSRLEVSKGGGHVENAYDGVLAIALTLVEAQKQLTTRVVTSDGGQEYWGQNETVHILPNRITGDEMPDGNETVGVAAFDYQNSDMSQMFQHILSSLKFTGLSGPVSFLDGDRVGPSVFYQNQDGAMRKVAVYYNEEDNLDLHAEGCFPVVWQDNSVPVDKVTIVAKFVYIDSSALYIVAVISITAVVMAVHFLIFNIRHRNMKYIKLSSPKLNNVIVIGCILVYCGVILWGADGTHVPVDAFPLLCTTRAFLFSSGFSLAFGAMFAKTYRVHKVAIKLTFVIGNKMLRDGRLLLFVGALFLLDGIVILAWVLLDPMHRQVELLPLEASAYSENVMYLPKVEHCYSTHMEKWLAAIYIYKGLLLTIGAFLAWETRKVRIMVMNDSRHIVLNIYNVVVMSVILVAISNLAAMGQTMAYVIMSSSILSSTTLALCVLFVPKMMALRRHPARDPIDEAAGLQMMGRSRRLTVTDEKEVLFRAEILNRVFKQEVRQLDSMIKKLEKAIKNPYKMDSYDIEVLLEQSSPCKRPTPDSPALSDIKPREKPNVKRAVSFSSDLVDKHSGVIIDTVSMTSCDGRSNVTECSDSESDDSVQSDSAQAQNGDAASEEDDVTRVSRTDEHNVTVETPLCSAGYSNTSRAERFLDDFNNGNAAELQSVCRRARLSEPILSLNDNNCPYSLEFRGGRTKFRKRYWADSHFCPDAACGKLHKKALSENFIIT